MLSPNSKILVFATKGNGTNEEQRILELASGISFTRLKFDKSKKIESFFEVFKQIRSHKPDLVVMEGSGVAGGLALILAHLFWGTKYVVSSGDAIEPFVRAILPLASPLYAIYERILYKLSSGFVGWTPYLVGRALTYGAPRAMTAAGWSLYRITPKEAAEARRKIREQFGIPANAIVIGIMGALTWNSRYKYCYGMEIVRAFKDLERADVYALIVGDGSGAKYLRDEMNEKMTEKIKFTGNVPLPQVIEYLSAMDLATLPQSVDQVGSFRYTTKVSEYFEAKLPIVMNQIPMAYDFESGWFWRLAGATPWSDEFIANLSKFLANLKPQDVEEKKRKIPAEIESFDKEAQVKRFSEFCSDILS